MIIYVPDPLLFGFYGITLTPNLVIISKDQKNNHVLHVHEAQHTVQMREVGTIKFWWKYLTDINARKYYEVDACRAGHAADPKETWKWASYLADTLGLFGPTNTPEERRRANDIALAAIIS